MTVGLTKKTLSLQDFYVMQPLFWLSTIAQESQQTTSRRRVLVFYRIAPCLKCQLCLKKTPHISLSWKLQSWTKVVETLSKKDLLGSTSEFSVSNFDISTPSPLFNVVTRWKCPWSVSQHWKGGEGVGYQQKICFLKLRKDFDRKRLFCSNVSTILSMIVVPVQNQVNYTRYDLL